MISFLQSLKTKIIVAGSFGVIGLLSFLPAVSSAQIKFNLKSHLDPSISSVEGFLVAILNVFIVIATPIIVMFIIYAGFLYVTAKGNAQQIGQASRALTYAVIGGVIVLGAVAIAQIVKNIVDAFAA